MDDASRRERTGDPGVRRPGRHPDDLAGVVLVAAGSPYFRAYPVLPGLRVLLSIQFVHAVASLVGCWPGDRLRFGGRQSRILLRDWARINRTGRFRFAGDPAYQGVGNPAYDDDLAELKLPVLAVSVEGDAYAPRWIICVADRRPDRRLVAAARRNVSGRPDRRRHTRARRARSAPGGRGSPGARGLPEGDGGLPEKGEGEVR